jgi:two-component system response regulator (stage 0 sporulation protein F)
VVDDQLGVRRLLYEAFHEDDFEVRMAGSGLEALDIIREFKPELILLDMKMPGMNGLETLTEIKKLNPKASVIMMTAYGELEIVSEALRIGAKEYITKPFDINVLRDMAKKVISCERAGYAG